MLLLVTIFLVLVAAVSLVIGFVQNSLAPIYISIGCSVAAAAVLLAFSRLSRRQVQPAMPVGAGEPGAAVPAGVGAVGAVVTEEPTRQYAGVGAATAARGGRPAQLAGMVGAAGGEEFPIADYDDLKVADILPLLDQLDEDELREVEERETAGRARATILRRVDDLLSGEGEEDLEVAGEAATPAGIPVVPPPAAVFPVPDYDDRKVSEILPVLGGLSDEELQAVRDREAAGAGRATILKRVDQLLGQAAGAPAAATKRTAKAASATKTAKTTAKKAGTAAKAGAAPKKAAAAAKVGRAATAAKGQTAKATKAAGTGKGTAKSAATTRKAAKRTAG